MLTKKILKEKWGEVVVKESHPFYYKKIDDSCITDLNIGLSNKKEKCLVLVLPKNIMGQDSFPELSRPINRRNIELKLHQNRELVLLLKDDFYFDEFLEFVIVVHSKISQLDELNSPLSFVKTVNDWLEFFNPSSSDSLSDSVVLGLLAELLVLERLLEDSQPSLVNSQLKGWKGPYHSPKDFQLDNLEIEVKYKNEDKNSVTISSEFQLNVDSLKPIHLYVVTGNRNNIGVSLSGLNTRIRSLVSQAGGDIGIYFKALLKYGLNQQNISDYNDIKVMFSNIGIYDASLPEFPSIQKKNLSAAISEVGYKLDLAEIEDFLIQKVAV
jgi:hypothetical protein